MTYFLKDHFGCSVDKINIEEEWKCGVLKPEGLVRNDDVYRSRDRQTVKMSQEVTKVAYGTGYELGQKQVKQIGKTDLRDSVEIEV